MTIQSLQMLHKLKSVQMTEDGAVCVDRDSLTLATLHDVNTPFVSISLEKERDSCDSIFQYLQRSKLIEIHGPLENLIMVTHDGWHYWQTLFSRFTRFLLTSIAVPVVVSIVTSIVTSILTLWIASWPKM